MIEPELLLTHVDSTVVANHGSDSSNQTDHRCGTIAIPITTVRKLGENRFRILDGCQHPKGYNHNEKSGNVEDQDEGFNERELLG